MKIKFVTDFPSKGKVVEVEEKTLGYSDLLELAEEALDVDLDDYEMVGTTYGQNCVRIDSTDEKSPVKDRWVVVFFAPPDERPQVSLSGIQAKTSGAKKAADIPESEMYKGFSVDNIIDMIDSKKVNGARKTYAFNYIEMYADRVFAHPSWLKASVGLVKTLVRKNRLNASELEVAEAMWNWAVKKGGGDDEKTREAFTPLKPYIRWLTVDQSDAPKLKSMLSGEQLLELTVYLSASKKTRIKKAAKLKHFNVLQNGKERHPRPRPIEFQFDPKYSHPNIKISNEGRTVTASESKEYETAVVSAAIIDKLEWKVTATAGGGDKPSVIVGVLSEEARQKCKGMKKDFTEAIATRKGLKGWGYLPFTGQRVYNSSKYAYQKALNVKEDVEFTCTLETKKKMKSKYNKCLSFLGQGGEDRPAYKIGPGRLYVAVSVSQGASVTISTKATKTTDD